MSKVKRPLEELSINELILLEDKLPFKVYCLYEEWILKGGRQVPKEYISSLNQDQWVEFMSSQERRNEKYPVFKLSKEEIEIITTRMKSLEMKLRLKGIM
jgi:hypothetical protein